MNECREISYGKEKLYYSTIFTVCAFIVVAVTDCYYYVPKEEVHITRGLVK